MDRYALDEQFDVVDNNLGEHEFLDNGEIVKILNKLQQENQMLRALVTEIFQDKCDMTSVEVREWIESKLKDIGGE